MMSRMQESFGAKSRLNIALWVGQVVIGVFIVAAAAAPKLLGESTAVEMFDDIGAGQWFRYFVGACELAVGVGLVIRRLSGLAAMGLGAIMAGAVVTQAAVLNDPALTATPAILLVIAALIAWGRWPETTSLAARVGIRAAPLESH